MGRLASALLTTIVPISPNCALNLIQLMYKIQEGNELVIIYFHDEMSWCREGNILVQLCHCMTNKILGYLRHYKDKVLNNIAWIGS